MGWARSNSHSCKKKKVLGLAVTHVLGLSNDVSVVHGRKRLREMVTPRPQLSTSRSSRRACDARGRHHTNTHGGRWGRACSGRGRIGRSAVSEGGALVDTWGVVSNPRNGSSRRSEQGALQPGIDDAEQGWSAAPLGPCTLTGSFQFPLGRRCPGVGSWGLWSHTVPCLAPS